MLLKEMSKKVAILGMSFGLIASPLAMAQSSIELNKDRSAGQGIIDKPQSQRTSTDAHISPEDLTRDMGDSLNYSASSSASDANESMSNMSNSANISPKDLTRDEGDSTEW